MKLSAWLPVMLLAAPPAMAGQTAPAPGAEALADNILKMLCNPARPIAAQQCYANIELIVDGAARDAMRPPTGAPELALIKAAERGLAQAGADADDRADWTQRLLLAKLARVRVLVRLARPAEAADEMRVLIAQAAQSFGNQPIYALFLIDYREVLQGIGRDAEAERLFRQALKLREATYGRRSMEASVAVSFLGVSRLRQRDFAGAEALLREALATRQAIEGDTIETVALMSHLAASLKQQGRLSEAISLLRRGIAVLEPKLPRDHWRVAVMQASLADLMVRTGQLLAAESLLIAAQRTVEARFDAEHPFRLRIAALLAVVSIRRGSEVSASRALLNEAAQHARQRLARYKDVDMAARSELDTLRWVFAGQVQATWALARR